MPNTMNAKQIATAARISPRTKHYVMCDELGLADDRYMPRHMQVMAALNRSDRTSIDFRERVVAMALVKSINTGRMNVNLARRVREDYTPYQICALVAKISAAYQGDPTIGDLADFWINAHAEQL